MPDSAFKETASSVAVAPVAAAHEEEVAEVKVTLEFGRFEGIWKSAGGTLVYEAIFDESNFTVTGMEKRAAGELMLFDGAIEWRVIAVDETDPDVYADETFVGAQGFEHVRGYYEPSTCLFKCVGYKVSENRRYMLGIDCYRCILYSSGSSKKGVPIMTASSSYGDNWHVTTYVHRVASKRELYELISDQFDERNIVNIITDLLHFIDLSTMSESKMRDYYFQSRLEKMDDPIIDRLCQDINDQLL